MKLKTGPFSKTSFSLFLAFFLLCFTASAEYTISTERPDVPDELICSAGAEGTLTFSELPLYFQLITIGCFLSFWFLGIGKFVPLLLGAVKCSSGDYNRKSILSFVAENPGCTETEILNTLGMKRGTFRYHKTKLKITGMLVAFSNGRIIRYFHRDAEFDIRKISVDSFKNDTRKNVLETILEEPGVTGKDLSSKLGLDKSTIHWHVNRLDEENIIRSERDGKFKRYYPDNKIQETSDKVIPVFSE